MKSDKTNLFKQISKIMRIPFSPQHSKKTMTDEEFINLISDEVVIEEKLDGATYLLEIPEEPDIYIFAEYLKFKHSISYNQIPIPIDNRFLWYVVFDIYDKKDKKFKNTEEKELYAKVYGFTISPLLFKGRLANNIDEAANFIKDLARQKSHFGDNLMEGVVIKSYNKQLFGKYINEEFRIEIHWRKKQIELNQLATYYCQK